MPYNSGFIEKGGRDVAENVVVPGHVEINWCVIDGVFRPLTGISLCILGCLIVQFIGN